jgi:hypothetical protein
MAGSKNAQVTASKVLAVLQAGWSAKVLALDTSYNDGITLTTPDAYYQAPQRAYGAALSVVVVAAPMERDYRGSERINGQTVLVGLVVGGNEAIGDHSPQEVVTIKLWRYAEAVTEILEENNSLTLSSTAWADETLVTSFDPSVQASDETEPGYEQRMLVTVLLLTSETD